MCAAPVSHIFVEFGAFVLAESRGRGAVDAQVRDRGVAGADTEAQGVGCCGGASSGSGAGEESDGGGVRFELHSVGAVGGGAAGEGAGGGSPKQSTPSHFWSGTPFIPLFDQTVWLVAFAYHYSLSSSYPLQPHAIHDSYAASPSVCKN